MRAKRHLALALLMILGSVLLGADTTREVPRASAEVKKDEVVFRVGKDLSSRYHVNPEAAKPYFWPLLAPNGKPLTRAWPMADAEAGEPTDHPHQKSAWFCHGDVIPEGLELKQQIKGIAGVDFWSEAKGHGQIVCTKVVPLEPSSTADYSRAGVATTNEWRTADGMKVLDEARKIKLYNYGPAQLYVVDSDLTASVVPVTFGDTKEGSFGVRVRDSMTEKRGKGRITNAEGKVGEKACWGMISAWCDYSGPSEGEIVGLAIFADPKNPYPTCWHSRAYGLMAANPFGRSKSGFPAMKGKTDLVRLNKGEHLKLRYGLFLHTGDVEQGKVASYYERFTKLPR
jgi:hypothetical protein